MSGKSLLPSLWSSRSRAGLLSSKMACLVFASMSLHGETELLHVWLLHAFDKDPQTTATEYNILPYLNFLSQSA